MSKETQNKWEEELEEIIDESMPFYNSIKVFIQTNLEKAEQKGKSETLEEVEREIKENFNNQNSMTITYYDLLQTINKMKIK